MAGFPYHSLEQYAHKLLSAGYRIALCEQVEDPKLAKGIVKRSVVEILTPGTAISSKYLNNDKNNFLISLFFKNNTFGYSILDNSTGEFYCGKSTIDQLNDIVNKNEIKEIIISKNQKDILQRVLKKEILVTTYDDWKADLDNCYEKLCNHFKTQSLKGYGIDDIKLCIISSGTCISYLEDNYYGNLKHISSISYLKEKGYMRLDSFTIKNLELFISLNSNNESGTLVKTIDKTVTSQGSRLLKQHICNPLADKRRINKRLELLDDLFKNINLNNDIQNCLKEISDSERIISKISNNKANPRDVLNLGCSLKINSKIKKIINNYSVKSLKKIINQSKNTSRISDKIINTIKSEPSIHISKGNYIKSGINKKLDEYRTISSNANDWLIKYQIKEQKKTKIPSLKIKYNRIFGYYIDITKTHLDKIPENYIRKQTLVNSERFYTTELKEYEEKILNAESNIIDIEKNIFERLNINILKNTSKIQFNSKILSKLDVFSSHAKTGFENNYVKPVFSNNVELEFLNSRHPVVEKLLPVNKEFIPNDLSMNQKDKQIAIITGPNMAGKSTFLRQIAHIILLGQIGSYVPAEYCKIGIVDQLFTRVGANDNISEGESTFLVEMNEAAYILNNATKNSFIILDEIGRGTSTFDGLSLAWAITEYIHNNKKSKARTLFATHYHELIALADKLYSSFNLNVEVKEFNDEIIFMRKIKSGGASKSYGIQVAEMAGLPNEIIYRAKVLLADFMKSKIKHNKTEKQLNLFIKESKLISELKKINIDKLSPIEALNKLNELKKQL